MKLDTHKQLFENVSSVLIELSDKIQLVETDLEEVKAASKDIEELKKIQNKLLEYASSVNQSQQTSLIKETKALYMSSGGVSFPTKSSHCNEILVVTMMLILLYLY